MGQCPVCLEGALGPFMRVGAQDYLRCSFCEATVMAEACRLSEEEERGIYELHENDEGDPGYRRFLSRLSGPLLERVESGSTGLDFGCGPGPVLAGMLEEAGMVMRLYDPFFQPDRSVLEAQYDFITCTEVVEHLHAPSGVFRALDRLLKPGGCLGIMTCFQTDDDRFANWHYRRDPTHVVFYREHTFRVLAAQLNWHLEIPAKDVVLLKKPS